MNERRSLLQVSMWWFIKVMSPPPEEWTRVCMVMGRSKSEQARVKDWEPQPC